MNGGQPSSAAINLRRILWLRVFTLSGSLLALGVAVLWFHHPLPVAPILLTLAALGCVSLATLWRLRQRRPVRDAELFLQLLTDVGALTVLLFLSGGSTNPFVMLYLIPLALAAAALRPGYVWSMAAITTIAYSALLFLSVPAVQAPHAPSIDFGTHVIGMWFGYLLSAGLIAGFAVKMSFTLREHEQVLAQVRENELRQERIVALGTFAAGTAHELGTPLATMAILIKDVEPGQIVSADKLDIMRTQIARCKSILASMSSAAGQLRAEAGRSQPLDEFLNELIERWKALHPGVNASVRLDGVRPAPSILAEQTLAQSITNILNNAADASPLNVEISGQWTNDDLLLDIADRGPGLSAELVDAAGTPFLSTKNDGLGLGLFLAFTTFNRFGGEVRLLNRPGGGALCRLSLPLATIRVSN